jgi:hypothetical protein
MGTLHEDIHIFVRGTQRILRMRNVSDKSRTENQNIILRSINFFWKLCHLLDKCEKIWYSLTGQCWHYYMARVICVPDNWGEYGHTHMHNI